MFRFFSCAVIAVSVFACSNSLVFASIIVYDNNAGGAAGIDGASISDSDFGLISADDVTLSATTTVTGIQWTGIYGLTSPGNDDFTVSIIADAAGAPTGGAPLASFNVGNAVNRVDSGVLLFGSRVYEYSADISFAMTAGTNYWVSIFNNTNSDPEDFFWGGLNGQGNSYRSGDGGANWSTRNDRSDFRLTAVPEPSSLSIFMLGIGMATLARRRRTPIDT